MFSTICTASLTFAVMLLLHHLYNYLKNSLTIPKVEDIYADVKPIETKPASTGMKDELNDYLKQFKKQT